MSYDMGWQPETQPKGKPPVEKTKGAETMKKLIDAEALKLSHCKECTLYPDKCMGKDCDCGAIIHINAMPTIDAVPVVRCCDCKYYEEQDETIGTCLLTVSGAHIKGYCSWAEVKEE